MKDEYDEKPEVLLDRLIRLSGTDDKGHYLTVYHSGPRQCEISFLKGVVLAMLARKRPPFQPSNNVVTISEFRVRPQNSLYSGRDVISSGETLEIARVHYTSNDTWHIEIKGHPGLLYRAEDFTLVPATDNPPDDAA